GWDAETVSPTVSELGRVGFIERGPRGLTRLRMWWNHNTIENPKVGTSAERLVEAMPDTTCEIFQRLIRSLEPFAERFSKQFVERYLNGIAYIEPEPEPEPSSEPNGSGRSAPQAPPPLPADKALFSEGLAYLTRTLDKPTADCR